MLAWGIDRYSFRVCNVQISECPPEGLCHSPHFLCNIIVWHLQVVQARVWAQGLTIGVLLVAGALTHSKRQEAMAYRKVCHLD